NSGANPSEMTFIRPTRRGLIVPFWDMHERLLARFCAEWDDQAAACGAYERHLARVRTGVAPDRLVDFPVGAGWAPLCEVLRCALPDVPFPVHNTREAFQKRMET
ncbi:MAG: sulfotransferase, partial [Pseudomonadota bacterium]